MKILYFAYGSNMLRKRLLARISSARLIGRAKLNGWRVVFNKKSLDGSGKANLIIDSDFETLGVLYELEETDLNKLDEFEKGYSRKSIQVYSTSGQVIEAKTYISDVTTDDPVAFEAYKQLVIAGAYENNLPIEYVKYLEQLPSRLDLKNK